MPPIIVARYSLIKYPAILSGALAAIALMFYTGLTGLSGRETSTLFKLAWIVSASLLLVLLIWVSRHFIFHRARAVWIDNGAIHWALGSRAITDINGVGIGTRTIDVGPLFYTVILLKNRNGGEDDVIAACLSEPAETIARRLRDMLNLPKSA